MSQIFFSFCLTLLVLPYALFGMELPSDFTADSFHRTFKTHFSEPEFENWYRANTHPIRRYYRGFESTLLGLPAKKDLSTFHREIILSLEEISPKKEIQDVWHKFGKMFNSRYRFSSNKPVFILVHPNFQEEDPSLSFQKKLKTMLSSKKLANVDTLLFLDLTFRLEDRELLKMVEGVQFSEGGTLNFESLEMHTNQYLVGGGYLGACMSLALRDIVRYHFRNRSAEQLTIRVLMDYTFLTSKNDTIKWWETKDWDIVLTDVLGEIDGFVKSLGDNWTIDSEVAFSNKNTLEVYFRTLNQPSKAIRLSFEKNL